MFTSLEKVIICRLQEDIPLVPEPYKEMARELGIEEDVLLNKIQEFSEKGMIRRFGSTLFHRKVGFQANAMVVWEIEEEKVSSVGAVLASFERVSHCYQRPTGEEWNYNLFTMIHGQSTEECEALVGEISNHIGEKKYEILYSTEELKKNSMKYFMEKEK